MLRQVMCSVGLLLIGRPASASAFLDDFSSATLDTAWQVVSFGGPRAYGYSSPSNHYSLSENPGFLRYSLDPMTHWDGFVTNFQSDSEHSCCLMDPGLELRREIGGSDWVLESKADIHLPWSNGRYFAMTLYFGDGQAGTYAARIGRGRDVYYNGFFGQILETTSLSIIDNVVLASTGFDTVPWGIGAGPTDDTEYWQIVRAGGVLSLAWSIDGRMWNNLVSYDFGSALDGKDQTLVLSGESWFNTAGSYADWDYVSLVQHSAAPEPETIWLMLSGLGMAGALRRKGNSA